MIQQVHTHPVVTTASSTTSRPTRAPKAGTALEDCTEFIVVDCWQIVAVMVASVQVGHFVHVVVDVLRAHLLLVCSGSEVVGDGYTVTVVDVHEGDIVHVVVDMLRAYLLLVCSVGKVVGDGYMVTVVGVHVGCIG